MKKKLFFGFALLAIVVCTTFIMNVSSNYYGLSDISLANVEALALSENGSSCEGCLQWDVKNQDYEGVKCKSDGCTEDYKGKCVKWCGE